MERINRDGRTSQSWVRAVRERKDMQSIVSKFYTQASPRARAVAQIPYADFSSCKGS